MNESKTYVFSDLNAVVNGDEDPQEVKQPQRQKVLRRRWREIEKKEPDALRDAVAES